MSQKFHHPGGKSQSGGETSDGDAPGFGYFFGIEIVASKRPFFAYQNLPWFYMTSKYVRKLYILNAFFFEKYYAVVAVCLKGTGWGSHISHSFLPVFGGWKTNDFPVEIPRSEGPESGSFNSEVCAERVHIPPGEENHRLKSTSKRGRVTSRTDSLHFATVSREHPKISHTKKLCMIRVEWFRRIL